MGIAVSFANHVHSNVVAMRFAHDLRIRVFERALAEPLASLETLAPGKLVYELAGETWRVCDAFFVLIRIAVDATIAAIFCGFLLATSPLYTGLVAVSAAIMALAVHLATRTVRQLGAAAVDANQSFMSYVWDALGGLRVIRGFGHEGHERRRFAKTSERVSGVFTRLAILSGTIGPITQILTIVMVAHFWLSPSRGATRSRPSSAFWQSPIGCSRASRRSWDRARSSVRSKNRSS